MIAPGEQAWLNRVGAQILRGDCTGAEALLVHALAEYPRSFELRRALAGVHQQKGDSDRAEQLLRELLAECPHDFATALTLARMLIAQARGRAAAQALQGCFAGGERGPELAITAIELLDEADRKGAAAQIAEFALTGSQTDARLHAYAGMLELQLGHFESAREHYLYALDHDDAACEWHAPLALANAQRYAAADHPDFARFQTCLQRSSLSDKARSTLLFALGKAHDDVGDHEHAAEYFRRANALARGLARWSRKDWRRAIEARLAAPRSGESAHASDDFIPIFIVGMPRSGTTLLAELLARFPRVRNRGELPWIARLAARPELSSRPTHTALENAAALYRAQAMQDDAGDARWFIDKQPLNFRYVDLMLAMFPNAKVIHCQRDLRATALSLWMQSFNEDVQGYAYDFNDIATVMRDCERLIRHWDDRYPGSMHAVHYEEVIADTQQTVSGISAWIGLSSSAGDSEKTSTSISSASLWQARQPVHSNSLERWKDYAPCLPELRSFNASRSKSAHESI